MRHLTRAAARWVAASACCGLALTAAGCGDADDLPPTVPAAGVLTLDGTPVEGAQVVVSALEGGGSAAALTNSQGAFRLRAFPAKDGALPGEYMVQVTKTVQTSGASDTGVSDEEAALAVESGEHAKETIENSDVGWQNVMPPQFANFTTSQVMLSIPEGGREDIVLDLKTSG